jgi:signal transduction histidine kinase
LGITLGVAALLASRAGPDYSLSGGDTPGLLLLLGAGWALTTVGILAARRRRDSPVGLLLVSAALAWFVLELPNPASGSGIAFTLGLVGGGLLPVVVAHAALAHPGGPLRDAVERRTVAGAYAVAIVGTGLFPTLTFDPVDAGCSQCPANLLAVTTNADLHTQLTRIALQVGLLWLPALALIIARRLTRASSAARKLSAPVLIPAAATAILACADDVHSLGRGFPSNDPTDRALWTGQGVTLLLLSLGVLSGWVRGRRARRAVARLTVHLDESRTPGHLRDVLAKSLADPSIELAYPLPGDRLVDAQLRPVAPPADGDQTATPMRLKGQTVAVLIHRADLRDDAALLGEVLAAAALAIHHERLQTEVLIHLRDLRAARKRIVAAGDAERRRLERDLHDGAQQRLVALALALRFIRPRLAPEAQTQLDAAAAELGRALSDLRALANGIYPAVLADEGLASAVDALEEAGPHPITIHALPHDRLAPDAEAAAYFLLLGVLRTSDSAGVWIRGERDDHLLRLQIGYDGTALPEGIIDLEDRVGALDGTLTVHADAGHVDLRAEIPCGS